MDTFIAVTRARAALAAVLLLAAAGVASAEGTFVPAADRVDHVYDEERRLLYISNGAQLLRYELETGQFLPSLTIGTDLNGMDLSPDGQKLVVADRAGPVVHIVDLGTLEVQDIDFVPTFGEGGTWTAAYAADGSILTTSTYQGSGRVPLRRYVPATGVTTIVAAIEQNTMLAPSADRSVIGFAEGNISDGRFGRYRVSNDHILRKNLGDGTGWFNYEMGASPAGEQYIIPTYGGTFVTDGALFKRSLTIGVHAAGQPVGVAYHPGRDRVYFPWAGTTHVKVYTTTTLQEVGHYEFEGAFTHPGNMAFQSGRAKVSRDGAWLFVSVPGGVRYVSLDEGGGGSGSMGLGALLGLGLLGARRRREARAI